MSDPPTAGHGPALNPLLAPAENAGVDLPLPRLDEITPQHVAPGVRATLTDCEAQLQRLETELSQRVAAGPTAPGLFETLVRGLEEVVDRLEVTWNTVNQLMGVANSDALREAHDEVQPEVVAFSTRLGQSQPLYRALETLRNAPDYDQLQAQEQRTVEVLLRDARLSGVGLEASARERFAEIERELAELATRFANHVLDATKRFELFLRDPAEVDGLPASWRALAAQAAREAGESGATAEEGPWRASLDAPNLLPFLAHGRRRDLRETLYRAYITRASGGELGNEPLIERILALRRELAQLLDYGSYAEFSLASKMATDVGTVESLLERLRSASYAPAEGDLAALVELASQAGAPEAADLQPWDVAFWSERLREERFAYSEEELRPYFPFPRVLEGLFELTGRLFGVRVAAADGEAPVYHPDVRFFRVYNADGRAIAAFYLDAYARPGEKRGGAWMAECTGRRRLETGTLRTPVAYLVCNQTPPVGDQPSLMTFDEVTTLFHEFGHGLQHMLTQVDCGLVSGLQHIEWDAIELPSQFMENWCYDRDTLRGISRHIDTGATLPDELFEKIVAARTFRAGSDMLRQLYFGLTDLELHHRYEPAGGETAFDVQRRVAERTTVLPLLPEDRFLCSFGHIFGGGYAAGYYSYKWAEVLSADAFAAFEEAGLDDPGSRRRVGERFRDTVLARGGSEPPAEVYRAFRGRDATADALLRQNGLS